MRSRMPLGDYLVAYLRRAGVTHLFGLPGDLVLNLFLSFAGRRGLEIVTLSHEPGVGFAADGYARSSGRMGVIVVTYGAGGHNVINPVAGCYSEEVPLLVISGGPGEGESRFGTLIHHQAKSLESQRKIFDEVTCATCVISHPERAASRIHELVQRVRSERRPGYLEIHRDVVDSKISVPPEIRTWDGQVPQRVTDRARVAEAARETADRINAARKPVLLVGIEAFRAQTGRNLVRLAERIGAPVVETMLSKSAFPGQHPLYMGVHLGRGSPAALRKRVAEADLLLALGALDTDLDMGLSQLRGRESRVWATGRQVHVSRHTYVDVGLPEFVRALLRIPKLRRHRERVVYRDNLHRPRPGARSRSGLAVNDLLWTVNEFSATHHGYHVVADSGDMLFGGLELRVPRGGLYLAQGFYASMGFSVPGALGAEIATGQRSIVLCGDGAFQMTGSELAHAPRLGCRPIVILVNNGGWGIFRPVSPRMDLLELPPWPYAQMAEGWGGFGRRVSTADELSEALEQADAESRFSLIEVRMNPLDLSPMSRRYIRESAARARR
ncbi:MAG: thiamine pyrophosphate-binding protein [Myxococcota bacterium]